ncbi:MAG: ribonuclease HI family protein [Candidatus Brennerbacteria bacterium]|nr:ribonuclease HI family protein [Candidatus Brennerbacteria bacterium]
MVSKQLFNEEKIIVYTDGGARSNPGPAAIGVVIGNKKYSEFIGVGTNNEAEYKAVILALKKLRHLIGKKGIESQEIEIRMDSELVQKQLSGEYKIKEKDLQLLFVEIWNLRLDFKNLSFVHIPREQNRLADKLVNEALDAN